MLLPLLCLVCKVCSLELPGPLHDNHHGLALPEQEDVSEDVQQVVRASILAALGPQCRLMCSLLPQYRTEATHVCSTTQLTIAQTRRADVSSGPASLYSPNIIIQSEKEDSSKVEKRPLLYISYNNTVLFIENESPSPLQS